MAKADDCGETGRGVQRPTGDAPGTREGPRWELQLVIDSSISLIWAGLRRKTVKPVLLPPCVHLSFTTSEGRHNLAGNKARLDLGGSTQAGRCFMAFPLAIL